MVQFQMSIVIGCTESLDMKHHVQDIGPVGMELQLNSFASEDYCTMKLHIVAIGLRFDMKIMNFEDNKQLLIWFQNVEGCQKHRK